MKAVNLLASIDQVLEKYNFLCHLDPLIHLLAFFRTEAVKGLKSVTECTNNEQ